MATKPRSAGPANTGLPVASRKVLVDVLNRLLADVVVLYIKTRNFHWNVTGPNFQELHRFFESLYEGLDEAMDDIAERARALDGIAAGSLAQYLTLARLRESGGRPDANAMLVTLLADYETLARQLRADVEVADEHDDVGTEDFLTGLLEDFEKSAWMLRSYLR